MKIPWSSVVIGGVVGVVAYRMGWLDMFFGKKDAMNADFITSGAPPAAMIRRNEGSVSQVMTDVQLLGGQATLTVPRLFPSVKTITDAPLV